MRIIVGITGASSTILGIRTLEVLSQLEVETHLVISEGGRLTTALECPDWPIERIHALAYTVHHPKHWAAAIASGSFLTDGMVIVPCSMKKVAEVAYSLGTDLISRAADVTLKEGRKLVLVPRESPLHLGHLRNLVRVAEIGAVVLPPIIGHYYQPQSVDDVIDHNVGKILDQFGLSHNLMQRWPGAPALAVQDRHADNTTKGEENG